MLFPALMCVNRLKFTREDERRLVVSKRPRLTVANYLQRTFYLQWFVLSAWPCPVEPRRPRHSSTTLLVPSSSRRSSSTPANTNTIRLSLLLIKGVRVHSYRPTVTRRPTGGVRYPWAHNSHITRQSQHVETQIYLWMQTSTFVCSGETYSI